MSLQGSAAADSSEILYHPMSCEWSDESDAVEILAKVATSSSAVVVLVHTAALVQVTTDSEVAACLHRPGAAMGRRSSCCVYYHGCQLVLKCGTWFRHGHWSHHIFLLRSCSRLALPPHLPHRYIRKLTRNMPTPHLNSPSPSLPSPRSLAPESRLTNSHGHRGLITSSSD